MLKQKSLKDFIGTLNAPESFIEGKHSLPPDGLTYLQDYPKAMKWARSLVDENTGAYDIESALNKIGVKVIKEDMGNENDISGYIEKRFDSWYIGVNKYEIEGRQRFTMAHEFAHLLFHRALIQSKIAKDNKFTDIIKIFRKQDDFRPIEMQANSFAAELLMPTKEFSDIWGSCEKLQGVSEYFLVSRYAAEYRARKLCLPKKES